LLEVSCLDEDFREELGFMWEFPAIREDLNAEARATGEELYMMALFDRALQAGLQTIILNQIATGQTTKNTTVTGKSTLARNAAMLGGMAALQKLDDIEENTEEVSEGGPRPRSQSGPSRPQAPTHASPAAEASACHGLRRQIVRAWSEPTKSSGRFNNPLSPPCIPPKFVLHGLSSKSKFLAVSFTELGVLFLLPIQSKQRPAQVSSRENRT
jgi:hypothetical protein